MIWKTPEESHECFLYWQKRALDAERMLESELDYQEFLLEAYTSLQMEFNELEQIVEDSFSEYTQKILKEERRRGMIEVDGNR